LSAAVSSSVADVRFNLLRLGFLAETVMKFSVTHNQAKILLR
jgi:hypothetical protein